MKGTNIKGDSGFAVMYTEIGAIVGAPDALIIYSGIDTDFINDSGDGPGAIRKMVQQQLAHGWGPPGSPEVTDLGCQVPIAPPLVEICGKGKITAIQLYASNTDCSDVVAGFANNTAPTSFCYLCTSDVPKEACNVALNFAFPNNENSNITATACGTLINLALLKAFNYQEEVDICLGMAWDPDHGNTVTYKILNVTLSSSGGGVTTTTTPPQPSTTTTLPPTTTTSANSTTTSTSGGGGGSGGSGGAKTTTTTVTTTSVPVTTTTSSIPNPPPDCETDAKCDDGIFCNGKETCSNGVCVKGQPPCGDGQLCKENLKQCWDVITITATSLNKSIWRPIIRQSKRQWLFAKVAEDTHYTADESSIAAVGSIAGAQGVSIDPRRKIFTFFKGKLFFIPVLVEHEATVGQWNIVIKTDIGSVPAEENIVTSFQVK
jgi:hypothetical protein